jgi:Papain-like cysteine protease AvrRpt2
MRIYKNILPQGLLLLLLLSGCCKPQIIGSVANTLRPQQTNNWCWAATTQMLAQHVGITVTQCDLANQRFGRTDCCNNQGDANCPKTNACNMPGWPMLTEVGMTFAETATARTWQNMRKQIFCSKKPMAWAYGTEGVVGHVLIIKGYVTVGGTNYLVLNDPWSPCEGEERLITYEEYVDPAGTSTHWNTWYNIAKN